MSIRVTNLRLPVEEPEAALPNHLARALGVSAPDLTRWRIVRKALDLRDKRHLRFVYNFEVDLEAATPPAAGQGVQVEQINEPPTCDPCSGNGEFTGSSCGSCRPLFERLRELWCAPCGSGRGCDTCGSDMYATGSGGSGYCPNCRDGVAGNPEQHVHHHTQHTPTQAMPQNAMRAKDGTNAAPQKAPNSTLEPVPDPNADAPTKSTPVQVEGANPQVRAFGILVR